MIVVSLQNESRNTEMLAAACAVGVSSCFGSPIGGAYVICIMVPSFKSTASYISRDIVYFTTF